MSLEDSQKKKNYSNWDDYKIKKWKRGVEKYKKRKKVPDHTIVETIKKIIKIPYIVRGGKD